MVCCLVTQELVRQQSAFRALIRRNSDRPLQMLQVAGVVNTQPTALPLPFILIQASQIPSLLLLVDCRSGMGFGESDNYGQ
jgi:hypothetical protein